MSDQLRRALPKAALGVAAAALGGFLFWRSLHGRSLAELTAAVGALPAGRVAAAALFAALARLVHTGFDYCGLIYAGARQPWRRAALGSFCSSSVGHVLDLFAATSSALRWRFWTRWGLSGEQTVRALLFCSFTVVIGHVALAGFACLAAPDVAARATGFGAGGVIALGGLCLAATVAYLTAAARLRAPIVVWGRAFTLPPPGLAAAQVAIGVADYACVVACLHEMIAGVADIGYPPVAAAYAAATVASAVTRAPSGLGVLETVVQALLPGPALVGPLLAYRVVDLVAPFVLGAILLAGSELTGRQGPGRSRNGVCA